jgi:hypothetical protein
VRRAEASGVTVWIALKEERKVTLRIFTGDSQGEGTGQQQLGTANTRPLGRSLHVTAITSTGTPLTWGTRYSYQLFFGPRGDEGVPVPADGPHLFTPDYVAATTAAAQSALLYSGAGVPTLPSFILPPADLAMLRLIHASWRKPHGEGRDALQALDHILAESFAGRGIRPHQLFLTGDQIYADGVADAMLKMLTDAGNTLLGWPKEETLPIAGPANTPSKLVAGSRAPTARDQGGLNSGYDMKSHLFSLGEFYAMYLFAWSDVLWPARDDIPRFENPTWPKARPITDLMTEYETERQRLAVYRDGLVAVRRTLANIATYMIFDDHEITDDWYISFARASRVLNAPLGKRVIQNGLAAYAVFQGWGNTPDRFKATQPGDHLLTALGQWDGTETHPVAAEIARRAAVPTLEPAAQRLVRPTGALDYHYVVVCPKHQVFVLDTRTHRTFPGRSDDAPALLDRQGLTAQLDPACQRVPAPDPDGILIVISPGPAVDVPFAEWGKGIPDPETGDRELWGFQPAAFEGLLASLARRCSRVVILSGDVHYGFVVRLEYWADSPYGGTGQARDAVVAQLTSSALKNQDSEGFDSTIQFHTGGYNPLLWRALPTMWDRIGWENPPGQYVVLGDQFVDPRFAPRNRPSVLRQSPALLDVGNLSVGTWIGRKPDWRYRVHFLLADQETAASRAFRSINPRPVVAPEATTGRAEALRQYLAASANHRDVEGRWGNGKEVVGLNNIGDITFDWRADRKAVVHQLWWWLEGPTNPFPLSKWTVSLDPVPRPTPVWDTPP